MRGVACAVLIAACSVKPAAFPCERDDQCLTNGVQGRCEPEQLCSFPDSRCSTGQRFGEAAGSLSGTCTGMGTGDDGGIDMPGGGGDGPPGRVIQGLVALFLFDESSGMVARDSSGLTPALDLAIGTNATWASGGLQFGAGASGATSAAAARIVTACMATDEMTLEAWIASGSTMMTGAARIIGVASDNNLSSSSLGQEMTGYYGQVRTSTSSTKLASPNNTTTTATLHLVHTRAAGGARTVYLDGAIEATTASTGDFSTWDDTMPISAGNALDGGVLWQGRLLLAAIYCRALSTTEVMQNFTAGP